MDEVSPKRALSEVFLARYHPVEGRRGEGRTSRVPTLINTVSSAVSPSVDNRLPMKTPPPKHAVSIERVVSSRFKFTFINYNN